MDPPHPQSVVEAARGDRTAYVDLIVLERTHKDGVMPLDNKMSRA